MTALAWASGAQGAAPVHQVDAQDEFRVRFKNMKVEHAAFDFGGQARVRIEYDGKASQANWYFWQTTYSWQTERTWRLNGIRGHAA